MSENISNIGHIEISPEGLILAAGHCDFDAAESIEPVAGGTLVFMPFERLEGLGYLPNWYYDAENDDFLERPAIAAPAHSIAADGDDSVSFVFPIGTVVKVNDLEPFTIASSDGLTLTTDTPGEILVIATPPFPYLPFRHVVVAHAP